MRTILFVIAALFALPAFAAGWDHYDNGRYGYSIDIPPDFAGQGEADNGDGQVFKSASGRETLTVWGSNIIDTDFSAEITQRMEWDKGDGWTISYQSTTPTWASWSGSRGGSVLYARAVALCGGTAAAFFTLEYSKADITRLDPVVNRLVKSLKGSGC